MTPSSEGWLDRFKKRREDTYCVISGEANEVPEGIVNMLPNLLQGYEPKDIFNANETGLFKLLPDRIYKFKGHMCHEDKKVMKMKMKIA